MANALRDFEKRARAVESRHRQLADGYVTRMDKDGVMRHAPTRRLRIFRPRMIVYMMLGLWAFKVFLASQLGLEAYNAHVAELNQGAALDRAGAYVMAVDPATMWMLEKIGITGTAAPDATPDAVQNTASN